MHLKQQILTTIIIIITATTCAQASDGGENRDSTYGSWFSIRPVDNITFRSYYLETNHPVKRYLLVNSDGDMIDRGMNLFTEIAGYGRVLDRLTFYYRVQNRNISTLAVKHASMKLSVWNLSLEYGLMNTWFGHGYHGSLIHSNNIDPVPMVTFQTERPLRIPYIGRFEYKWVNAFPEGIRSIMTHRLLWSPAQWMQLGVTQNVFYTKDYFRWHEFPRVLTGINANFTPGNRKSISGNSEMRASVDIAFFLTRSNNSYLL